MERRSKDRRKERGDKPDRLTAEHGILVRLIRGVGKGAVLVPVTHPAGRQTERGPCAAELGVHALLRTCRHVLILPLAAVLLAVTHHVVPDADVVLAAEATRSTGIPSWKAHKGDNGEHKSTSTGREWGTQIH